VAPHPAGEGLTGKDQSLNTKNTKGTKKSILCFAFLGASLVTLVVKLFR
jgi:hypothetical protein